MSDPAPARATAPVDGPVTYEDVRVVITPEAPYHYQVKVSDPDGEHVVHDVENVHINAAAVVLDDPVWFVDAKVDVGIPLDGHGDTVWVWC